MSDRRTFLGNAAAAAVIAKISPLRTFGFTSDGPHMIHPTISDREKAGLRGPVKQYTEETVFPGVQGHPETITTTMEYDPDGRILSTSSGPGTDGSKWVSTNTYDDNGRLTKTISGLTTEPGPETLYAYDEAGRLLSISISSKEGGSKTDFHYDEQGRKTAVQHFDPETFKQGRAIAGGSLWDAAVGAGAGVPEGGNITTIYDANDQPTEAQIRDREGRLVTRFVRTYDDANGRILEEEQILENPALLFDAKRAEQGQPQFNAAQLEALNRVMKSTFGGWSDAGITYAYDAQGRVTERRRTGGFFNEVTTISYNEHGDKSAEHATMTSNLSAPANMAFSMDENGTIIPDGRATEPTESPALSRENDVLYEYEYDSYGNWTQLTQSHSYSPDSPPNIRHRKLTYY